MAERNAFEELLYLQAKETDWTLLPDIEAVEINWDHKFKLNFDSIPDPEERAAVWFDFNVSTKRGLGELSTFKEVPERGHFFINKAGFSAQTFHSSMDILIGLPDGSKVRFTYNHGRVGLNWSYVIKVSEKLFFDGTSRLVPLSVFDELTHVLKDFCHFHERELELKILHTRIAEPEKVCW